MKKITKSTVVRATIAAALISILVSISIAAVHPRKSFLKIMDLRIEQYTGGNWNTAPQLINGRKYRFRLDVANVASEKYRNQQYDKIRFKISGQHLKFKTSAGIWKNVYEGTPNPAMAIGRGESKSFYVYFTWGGANQATVPMHVKVSMGGRMFIMGGMGPEKIISPNM